MQFIVSVKREVLIKSDKTGKTSKLSFLLVDYDSELVHNTKFDGFHLILVEF